MNKVTINIFSQSTKIDTPRHFGKQSGVGLIEIMIAMVLGLLILLGVSQIFLSNKQTYNLQTANQQKQESSRYAISKISQDARMSGYKGCTKDIKYLTNTLNNPTSYLSNFLNLVGGYEGGTSTWSPTLDSSITGVKAGTDVLVLRTSIDNSLFTETVMASATGDIKLTNNTDKIAANDILLITDCISSAVFQVSTYTKSSGTIVHNTTATTGVALPGNASTNLGKKYPVNSEIVKMSVIAYYIKDMGGDEGYGLYRKENNKAEELVIDGISNMQLLFGEDTDNDLSPNDYIKASSVVNWNQVVAIKIGLMAESKKPFGETTTKTYSILGQDVGSFSDKKARSISTTTIALRNNLP